ncbi:MAG: DNA polymerase III subunit delta [Actinocatenispora sp.]
MTATVPPVRLVLGDEELLVARAVAAVVAAVRETEPHAEVQECEAGALTAGELAVLTSPSLFGGRRIVVVRNAQDAKKDLVPTLLGYAGHPVDDVCLVMTHLGGNKGKAIADDLQKLGVDVVRAAKITRPRERVAFVRDEVRQLGGRCPEDAAEALLAAIGNDLRELASACSQLVADTGGSLSVELVNRYYQGRAEVSGFTVADAAMVGDAAGALEALRWALHVGVDPVPIADALADGVRTASRVAGARGNAYQLASKLGVPPWKVERAQRQARGWLPEGLAQAMHAAAAANADVKGGAEDRAYALERAVLAVAGARQVGHPDR